MAGGIPSMSQRALQLQNPLDRSLAMTNAASNTLQAYDKKVEVKEEEDDGLLADITGWVGLVADVVGLVKGLGTSTSTGTGE